MVVVVCHAWRYKIETAGLKIVSTTKASDLPARLVDMLNGISLVQKFRFVPTGNTRFAIRKVTGCIIILPCA
jgi:hypothetical protein